MELSFAEPCTGREVCLNRLRFADDAAHIFVQRTFASMERRVADLDVEVLYMASEFLSMGAAKGYLGESEDTPSQHSVCRHLMHPS